MYTILVSLFIIAALMLGAGFLGRTGTSGFSDINANIASTFALIATYSVLFLYCSSFSELGKAFSNLCGGIPYLNDLADYGSFRELLHANPIEAVSSFFDAVILSAVIDILSLLPMYQPGEKDKRTGVNKAPLMTRLFFGVILSFSSLFILNYIIKASSTYKLIISVAGSLIALISIGTIPLAISSIVKKDYSKGFGFIGLMIIFSKSKIVGIIRDAFFKAIIYVAGIWILENRFSALANTASSISNLAVAFGPVIIIIIGIGIMMRSVFGKKDKKSKD